MQIRFIIYIVLFLVTSFILNILLYFISSDYRLFLKNIKSDNSIEQVSNDNFDGNENIFIEKNKYIDTDSKNSVINDAKSVAVKIKDNNKTKVELSEIIGEIKETNIEKDFLNKFKEYKLKKLELHPRLFDLTTEYPDEYIEYYSEYLTLYFFGNKPYDELKDVFKVLTYELPFTINKVDNFGEKSFYINLDNEFQDNQIRIVILYKNRTFGLKISKEVYLLLKDKLDRLK